MNVLLVYNPNAGKGKFSEREIGELILKQGHTLRIARKQDTDLERHLVQRFDLVAVAGGDGTVTKVAMLLLNRSIPLTVLPLGTANNLAHSMGIEGDPATLVPAWKDGTVVAFDAARVIHPRGEQIILESAGLGLFTEAMCLAIAHSEKGDKLPGKKRFDRDFRLLRRLVDTLPSFPCSIEIDGRRSRKQVLLCEIMNTRQAGSRLVLAPEARTDDGLLDLVLVSEKERPLLNRFLHRDPSDDHPPHLPVRQGRRFRISSRARRVHLADRIERFPRSRAPWRLDIEVLPGALRVFLPAGTTAPAS